MKFESLSRHHQSQLLNFELENKEWFELKIVPRTKSFYSKSGVSDHIDVLINQMHQGTAYSGVVLKNNIIIARANIKDISSNLAYVGYRVAKNFTSQGVGSYCLAQLIDKAKNELNLNELRAQVLNNNPASMHILKKFGFSTFATLPNFLTLNGRSLTCTEVRLQLN